MGVTSQLSLCLFTLILSFPGYEDSAIESHRDEEETANLSLDASSLPPTERSSAGVDESTASRVDSVDSGLGPSSLTYAPEMPTLHEDVVLGQCPVAREVLLLFFVVVPKKK